MKYIHEKAQKEKGDTSADSLKAVMEAIGSATDFSARYSLVMGNPKWTASDHTTANADYSKLWGLVKVSVPVDGMYVGEELPTKD